MSQAEGVFSRFGWFALEKVVRLGIGFVVGAAVARHLGSEDFGLISYSAAVISFFSVFAGFGIDALVVRDLSQSDRNHAEILGSALLFRGFMGVLATVLCCVYALAVEPSGFGVNDIILIQSLIMLFGWGEVLDAWFQSKSSPRAGIFVRIGAGLIGACIRLYLIWMDAAVIAFVVAGVVEAFFLASGMYVVFKRDKTRIGPLIINSGRVLNFALSGWPLAVSAFLVIVVMQGDRIMLGRMVNIAELGMYSVSARFLDVMMILPVIFGLTLQRMFAKVVVKGEGGRAVEIQRVWAAASWISVIAAAILWATADWIIPLVFGPEYMNSIHILKVHAWIVVFVMQVSLRSRLLIAEGYHGLVMKLSAVTAAVQVGLLPYAISEWGSLGAAYATLTAWICGACVAPLLFSKSRWFVVAFFKGILLPFSLQKHAE